MQTTPDLSKRAAALIAESPVPAYIAEHMERSADTDPDDPDRYIGLCVAENLLMWDVLEPMLNRSRNVQSASVAYDNPTGSSVLRERIAEFGSNHVWGRTVEPDNIVLLAGAGAILETLFYVLADPGDDEHEDMLVWLGGKYEPGEFAAGKVKFDNPGKRWKIAFGEA
jgi:aspartate/methionine/tyrosine aminotransferase